MLTRLPPFDADEVRALGCWQLGKMRSVHRRAIALAHAFHELPTSLPYRAMVSGLPSNYA
jgi:hypothetical protein